MALSRDLIMGRDLGNNEDLGKFQPHHHLHTRTWRHYQHGRTPCGRQDGRGRWVAGVVDKGLIRMSKILTVVRWSCCVASSWAGSFCKDSNNISGQGWQNNIQNYVYLCVQLGIHTSWSSTGFTSRILLHSRLSAHTAPDLIIFLRDDGNLNSATVG